MKTFEQIIEECKYGVKDALKPANVNGVICATDESFFITVPDKLVTETYTKSDEHQVITITASYKGKEAKDYFFLINEFRSKLLLLREENIPCPLCDIGTIENTDGRLREDSLVKIGDHIYRSCYFALVDNIAYLLCDNEVLIRQYESNGMLIISIGDVLFGLMPCLGGGKHEGMIVIEEEKIEYVKSEYETL